MARKPEPIIKRVNVATWMTSFSDLLSLLLCFFVMLLTMRAMDNKKFEVAITGFGGAFGVLGLSAETGMNTNLVVPIGPPVPDRLTTDYDKAIAERFVVRGVQKRPRGAVTPPEPAAYRSAFETERDMDRLTTRIDAAFLFDEGTAELEQPSRLLLEDIAMSMRSEPGRIRVEAFVVPHGVEGDATATALAVARAAAAAEVITRPELLSPSRVVIMGMPTATPDARSTAIQAESLVLTVEFHRASTLPDPITPPARTPGAFDPLQRVPAETRPKDKED